MNDREKKLYKILAMIGAFVLIALFLALIIVGIFFSQHGIGLMLGLIAGITILAVLIYAMLMFIRMRNK